MKWLNKTHIVNVIDAIISVNKYKIKINYHKLIRDLQPLIEYLFGIQLKIKIVDEKKINNFLEKLGDILNYTKYDNDVFPVKPKIKIGENSFDLLDIEKVSVFYDKSDPLNFSIGEEIITIVSSGFIIYNKNNMLYFVNCTEKEYKEFNNTYSEFYGDYIGDYIIKDKTYHSNPEVDSFSGNTV
jgi:hypothetical protein